MATDSATARVPSRHWLIAILVFAIAFGWAFGGAARHVSTASLLKDDPLLGLPSRADLLLQSYLVSRHGVTWPSAPWALFDTEHCAPLEKSLTLGVPMLTLGLLAVPVAAVSDNATFIFNVASWSLTLFAAFAMYLLVFRWTGVPSAGLVAGLLYAFHPIRLAHIHHPSVWDTTWTVFALYFAERLFSEGRWRDALLLGLACALQIGASFYSLLAAVFLAPPLALWLFRAYGWRTAGVARLVAVVTIVLLAVYFFLSPYLSVQDEFGLARPEGYAARYFAAWASYLPGSVTSPGVAAFGLAVVAIFAGRRGLAIAGDPRAALVAGGLLVAFLAAGDDTARLMGVLLGQDVGSWSPYDALGRVLPGLTTVRGVERLSAGVHLAVSVLAGIGAATLLRRARGWAPGLAVLLVAVAFVEVARPVVLGLEPLYGWKSTPIGVDQRSRRFFEDLAATGNAGPLFELPSEEEVRFEVPRRIFRAFDHRRRTSACFASYQSPLQEELDDLADRVPDATALRRLREHGFTTLIVEQSGFFRFRKATTEDNPRLRLVHRAPGKAAYEILEPWASAAEGAGARPTARK